MVAPAWVLLASRGLSLSSGALWCRYGEIHLERGALEENTEPRCVFERSKGGEGGLLVLVAHRLPKTSDWVLPPCVKAIEPHGFPEQYVRYQ